MVIEEKVPVFYTPGPSAGIEKVIQAVNLSSAR
jgi:hypothetical protein